MTSVDIIYTILLLFAIVFIVINSIPGAVLIGSIIIAMAIDGGIEHG